MADGRSPDSDEHSSTPSTATVYCEAISAATSLDVGGETTPDVNNSRPGGVKRPGLTRPDYCDDNEFRPYCKITLLALPMPAICHNHAALGGAPCGNSPASAAGSRKFNWQVEELILMARESTTRSGRSREVSKTQQQQQRAPFEAVWLPGGRVLPAPNICLGTCINFVVGPLGRGNLNRASELAVALGGSSPVGDQAVRLLVTLDLHSSAPQWKRTATLHRGRELAAVTQIPLPTDGSMNHLVALGGCCTGMSVELIHTDSGNCRTAPRLLDARFSAAAAVVVFDQRKFDSTTVPKLPWGFVLVVGGRNCANRGEVLRTTERLDLHALDPANFRPAVEGMCDLEAHAFSPRSTSDSDQLRCPEDSSAPDTQKVSPAAYASWTTHQGEAVQLGGVPSPFPTDLPAGAGGFPETPLLKPEDDDYDDVAAPGEVGAPISRWCLRGTELAAGTTTSITTAASSWSPDGSSALPKDSQSSLASISVGSIGRQKKSCRSTEGSESTPLATWEPARPLSQARFDCTAATIPSTPWIIVIGGSTGAKLLATTELHNPVANISIAGPLMCNARNRPAVTITPDGIVVVYGGGGHFGGTVNSIEVWDATPLVRGERLSHFERFLEVPVKAPGDFAHKMTSYWDSAESELVPIAMVPTVAAQEPASSQPPSPSSPVAVSGPKLHTVVASKLFHQFEPLQSSFESLAIRSWSLTLRGDQFGGETAGNVWRRSATLDVARAKPHQPFRDNPDLISAYSGGAEFNEAASKSAFLRSSTAPLPARGLSKESDRGRSSCFIPQGILRVSLHSKFVEKLKRRGSWGSQSKLSGIAAEPSTRNIKQFDSSYADTGTPPQS